LANDLTAPAPGALASAGASSHGLALTAAAPNALPLLAPLLLQLRAQPRLPLIIGTAVLAAALAAAVLWGRAPEYKLLYANINDRDGGAIIASLQQMNVPYKFSEGGGAILVAADKAAEVRLKLAAQGLPKAGAVGFELLDNQKFGTSQFAEQVNYQRGLEGELARSIESMGPVQSARVHLAMPKATLFVREQKKPSASVVLTLQPGRSVDDGQVSAIVHMVSSSVPELDANSVTVVDQRGNLLSAANSTARGLDGSQLKYMENIEQSYVRRIETILQPLVGPGNVRAQVAADVDFSVVEHTDEKYRPSQEAGGPAIRSQQSSESAQDSALAAGGVPGALSNQPPLNPTAPLSVASAPAGAASAAATASTRGGRGNARKDVTTNYELDHSIRHTQQAAGATRRLSVAVVVNYKEVRAANGKTSMVPLTAVELEQVRNLVKEAMGFDPARGDSLNVVNSPFSVDTYVAPEVPYWKDRDNIELARSAAPYLLIFAAAAFAWLAVLRPMQRRAVLEPAQAQQLSSDAPARADAAAAARLEPPAPDPAIERLNVRRKADLEYAQQVATDDPRLVASLVRHWTNS
jgi:flagellar M-ring protein FliF